MMEPAVSEAAMIEPAVSAAAEVPVILTLPIVVISNSDALDQGAATPKSIFRYLNALDLMERVDWRNPTYAESAYRLYWTDLLDTSGIHYRIGHADGWVDRLTARETDDLLSAGTEPTGKDLYQPSGGFLNLLNWNALTTTALAPSRPLNPFVTGLTIGEVGLDHSPSSTSDTGLNFLKSWASGWPVFQAGLTDAPTELVLIAAVTSGTQVLPSAPEVLQIYSLLNDPAGDRVIEPGPWWPPPWPDPYGRWVRAPNVVETSLVKPPGQHDPAGKVGFTVLPTDDPAGKIMFASWNLGTDGTQTAFPLVGDAATMAGKLYEADLRIRCDAARADLCPGYRVEYANAGFTHFGGVEVSTYDPANAPYANHDFWVTLLWEVPFDCSDMADDGTLANFPGSQIDYRDYTLLFDLFHNQYGDYGVLTLEEVRVQPIDKPSSADSSMTYGNYGDWVEAFVQSDPFFARGAVTRTSGGVTIVAGAYDGQYGARFAGAFPPLATGVGQLNGNVACRNNRDLSLSCEAASVNIETTPIVRLYLTPTLSDSKGTWGEADYQDRRNMIFFAMFGAVDPFAKLPTKWGGRFPDQPNPGVPSDGAGSTLALWIYTHGGYHEMNDYWLPNIQVLSLNRYSPTGSGSGSGWEDDSGGITFSNVTLKYYD